jgi:hypothetical protein
MARRSVGRAGYPFHVMIDGSMYRRARTIDEGLALAKEESLEYPSDRVTLVDQETGTVWAAYKGGVKVDTSRDPSRRSRSRVGRDPEGGRAAALKTMSLAALRRIMVQADKRGDDDLYLQTVREMERRTRKYDR